MSRRREETEITRDRISAKVDEVQGEVERLECQAELVRQGPSLQ